MRLARQDPTKLDEIIQKMDANTAAVLLQVSLGFGFLKKDVLIVFFRSINKISVSCQNLPFLEIEKQEQRQAEQQQLLLQQNQQQSSSQNVNQILEENQKQQQQQHQAQNQLFDFEAFKKSQQEMMNNSNKK